MHFILFFNGVACCYAEICHVCWVWVWKIGKDGQTGLIGSKVNRGLGLTQSVHLVRSSLCLRNRVMWSTAYERGRLYMFNQFYPKKSKNGIRPSDLLQDQNRINLTYGRLYDLRSQHHFVRVKKNHRTRCHVTFSFIKSCTRAVPRYRPHEWHVITWMAVQVQLCVSMYLPPSWNLALSFICTPGICWSGIQIRKEQKVYLSGREVALDNVYRTKRCESWEQNKRAEHPDWRRGWFVEKWWNNRLSASAKTCIERLDYKKFVSGSSATSPCGLSPFSD